ncbi:CatB-related O-acetyltransferase [Psychrobacter sp. H8-1]|uniref:CatB-related O-acetyltransferase n=1 Tax=Psychrobacter sp. H8-1 TaxID=2774129 RepID=UPI001918C9E6|nr:CatB-related O-acetyltransferase [Psychrobacter sp. H8-1]
MSTIIKLDKKHIELIIDQKVFLNSRGTYIDSWLKTGRDYNTYGKAIVEPYSGIWIGPRLSSIGSFSYTKSYFPPQEVKIGRYCAIAENVKLMGSNHPMDRLSVCGFCYSKAAPYGFFEKDLGIDFPKKSPNLPSNSAFTTIENDVWIGEGVLIKKGVTIGTGSIIASRSVVTKDVPPYSIVAGSPATLKKYRFSESLIEQLLSSEWWNYKYTDFKELNILEPNIFVSQLNNLKLKRDIKPFINKTVDIHEEFRIISNNL